MDLSWDYDTIWRSGSDVSLGRPIQKGVREYISDRERFYILENSGKYQLYSISNSILQDSEFYSTNGYT